MIRLQNLAVKNEVMLCKSKFLWTLQILLLQVPFAWFMAEKLLFSYVDRIPPNMLLELMFDENFTKKTDNEKKEHLETLAYKNKVLT